MSAILLGLGVYVLVGFTFRGLPKGRLDRPLRRRFLAPLGLVAGFLDATGGGGWGPVGTPALLASGRMEPRKVIGSTDTSEFLVAVAAGLGFLFSLGSQGIDVMWVAAFLLGSAVGGVIVVTNARTLLTSDVLYVALYALWAAALAYSVRAHLKERNATVAESAEERQPVGT
ncbi:TSUP family transporter [Streptomyces sp. NPDC048384]|uniref:TSUP family transporter n=1 Tax=Streptomyces sp. NPDC048384 TaxID=3155487 RepID=UPI003419F2FD